MKTEEIRETISDGIVMVAIVSIVASYEILSRIYGEDRITKMYNKIGDYLEEKGWVD